MGAISGRVKMSRRQGPGIGRWGARKLLLFIMRCMRIENGQETMQRQ